MRAQVIGVLCACAMLVAWAGENVVASSTNPMDSSLSNGQAIFRSGRDLAGARITARSTPLFGSCAGCHRVDGSGGMRLPEGAVSADLRHRALVTLQKHPYTLALLERAISTGVDNEGKQLSPVMPRWRLSARDLHDVAQYVLLKLK